MKVSLLQLFLFSFVVSALAADENRSDGQVPNFDPFAVQKLEKPFEYYPLNAVLWREMNEKLDKKKFAEVISLGEKNQAGSDVDAGRAAEGRLIWSIGLAAAGYPYAAMFVLMDIAVSQAGSAVSSEALRRLD